MLFGSPTQKLVSHIKLSLYALGMRLSGGMTLIRLEFMHVLQGLLLKGLLLG